MLDVLVIAPHPDDAELGMGGAILRIQAVGMRVGVLDLTDGEPTPHGSPEIRARETAAATEVLGLAWRGNLGLPKDKDDNVIPVVSPILHLDIPALPAIHGIEPRRVGRPRAPPVAA